MTPIFCADSVYYYCLCCFLPFAAIISCSCAASAREIIVLLSCCYCLSLNALVVVVVCWRGIHSARPPLVMQLIEKMIKIMVLHFYWEPILNAVRVR